MGNKNSKRARQRSHSGPAQASSPAESGTGRVATPANPTNNSVAANNPTVEAGKGEARERIVGRYMLASTIVSTVATVVIAGASIVAFVVAYWQYGVFDKQLNEMRSSGEQTNEMIKAMKATAEAAKKQANALEKAQRAWLAPARFELSSLSDTTDKLRVRLFFQNVGREPAVATRLFGGINFLKPLTPDAIDWPRVNWSQFPELKPERLCGKDLIAPPSVVYANLPSLPSVEFRHFWQNSADPLAAFGEVAARKTLLVVAGCLQYESLGITHGSTFCAFLHPLDNQQPGQWSFQACGVGNNDIDVTN